MTERRETLTPQERALLRQRAAAVVPIGIAIGAAVVWMLRTGMAEMSDLTRGFFGLFFGGLLIFIVGGHVVSTFETHKLIRSGVVTGKRVGVTGTNSRTSPHYYLSLDGKELWVEQWAYQRVHTGQTVELLYTARLQNLYDVTILSDPASPDVPFVSQTWEEPLLDEDRLVLRDHLFRAVVRRGLGGVLLGGLTSVVGMLVCLVAGADPLLSVAPLPGVLPFVILNFQTLRLLRDFFDPSRCVATEQVIDVVRSNRPLLSPNIIVSGTGTAGEYAWVQTQVRWVQVQGPQVERLGSGTVIEVATAPRSGVVLAADGVPALRTGFGVIDVIVLIIFLGTLLCMGWLTTPVQR